MAEEPEVEEAGMPRSPFPERRLPGPTEDLPMDVELLKVLASDSRRDILQHLRKRRMTLTELAHALDLKKATVLEHLKKLTDAGLIKRMEDERLWVYYELTHRGGRIVSPQRTRFYLMMGVTVAALVVGGLAVALVANQMGTDVLGRDDRSAEGLVGSSPSAVGGSGVSVDVTLGDADATRTRAYLVTAKDAAQLRTEGGAVAGIPLALDETKGDVARYRSLSAVPPGNYYLYIVDEAGRDNLDTLSEVRVPSLQATGPTELWRGLAGPSQFSVARDGQPATGTLLLAAGDGRELPTLALENGTGILGPQALDRLVATRYQLQYLPEGTQYWIVTDQAVDVREPLFAVEPLYALEGTPTRFQVALAGAGTRVQPIPAPALANASPAAWSVDPDGSGLEATFTPDDPGARAFTLGRLEPVPVEVIPDVRVRLEPENGTVRLHAFRAAGSPLAEVAVGLGARTLDLTDENGTVAFAPPAPGAHELRLTLPDGTFVARGLLFDGENWTEERPNVRVRDTTANATPDGLVATGVLLNEGAASQKVTLSLQVDGRTVATRAASAASSSAINVTFHAPLRLAPGEHGVRIVATPLHQVPIVGAPLDDAARFDAADADGLAGAPEPSTVNATSGSEEPTYAYLQDSAKSTPVVLRVAPSEPALPPPQTVVLEERGPPAGATEGERAAPEARAPGPGAALLALALVAAALAARRRRG